MLIMSLLLVTATEVVLANDSITFSCNCFYRVAITPSVTPGKTLASAQAFSSGAARRIPRTQAAGVTDARSAARLHGCK
jgi:hypothetical protein